MRRTSGRSAGSRLNLGAALRLLEYQFPGTARSGPAGSCPIGTSRFRQSTTWAGTIFPQGSGPSTTCSATGRRPLKVNLGRYVLAQRLTSDYTNLGNPVNAMANLVTRSWNDRGGLGVNGDYIPQCDLTECGGERGVRGAERRAVRPADPQHGVRSGDASRMEQAAGGLGVRGRRPAPAAAAGRRGCRLLPPLVRQLHGHRQPGDGGVRLHPVQRPRAGRSSPAERRRVRRVRALRPQPEQSRAGQ